MEIYEKQTDEVIRLFLVGQISFAACLSALDSALEEYTPRCTPGHATRLRVVMLSNNDVVMNEMLRRRPNTGNLKAVLSIALEEATKRTEEARSAFYSITNQLPSGLPRSDGTQRIHNASQELAAARAALMIAHTRLNDYVERGTYPRGA